MVSAFRPFTRCSSAEANLEGQPGWTKNMIDMSPPAFLWLSSGLRACGELSTMVAEAGIITGTDSTFEGTPFDKFLRDGRLVFLIDTG
jgi:hypothetical protein